MNSKLRLRRRRKLSLKRSIIRRLTDIEQRAVVGGIITADLPSECLCNTDTFVNCGGG